MTYPYVFLRRAQEDVRLIARWLKKRSLAGALAWRYALNDAVEAITADPFQWSKVAEGKRLPVRLRQYLFRTRAGNTYRIVYLVEGNEVRVLRVRGPGQRMLRNKDFQG